MAEISDNNQALGQSNPGPVSPDQLSLFQEESPQVTRLDISHQTLAEYHDEAATEPPLENSTDEVSGAKKIKILAALAIVAAAGYIAYWVQEPVQIKADITSGTDLAAAADAMPGSEDESMPTDNETDNSVLSSSTSPSVNVDVSLFGFEPATLKIDKGTTVIWTNTSTEDQTIVGSSEDGQSFVSPVLASGDSFTYEFDQNASFQYYSTYNPALKATILIGLGSMSADSTTETASETENTNEPDSALNASAPEDSIESNTSTPGASLESGISETAAQSDSATEAASMAETTADTDELKSAAPDAPSKLSKTGPEDLLYLVALLVIGWLNRKTLLKAVQKY